MANPTSHNPHQESIAMVNKQAKVSNFEVPDSSFHAKKPSELENIENAHHVSGMKGGNDLDLPEDEETNDSSDPSVSLRQNKNKNTNKNDNNNNDNDKGNEKENDEDDENKENQLNINDDKDLEQDGNNIEQNKTLWQKHKLIIMRTIMIGATIGIGYFAVKNRLYISDPLQSGNVVVATNNKWMDIPKVNIQELPKMVRVPSAVYGTHLRQNKDYAIWPLCQYYTKV